VKRTMHHYWVRESRWSSGSVTAQWRLRINATDLCKDEERGEEGQKSGLVEGRPKDGIGSQGHGGREDNLRIQGRRGSGGQQAI
jgi:hypothetical protein